MNPKHLIPAPENVSLAWTQLARLGIVVSTIWRRSSACVNSPPWFFETLVFKGDSIIEQESASYEKAALAQHCALCERMLAEHDYAPFERMDWMYDMPAQVPKEKEVDDG
ncbi:hypothetical protein KAW64_05250 [bacterium]|nr:hypothetical protein [bacterium]